MTAKRWYTPSGAAESAAWAIRSVLALDTFGVSEITRVRYWLDPRSRLATPPLCQLGVNYLRESGQP
jgi:hypothetical protein